MQVRAGVALDIWSMTSHANAALAGLSCPHHQAVHTQCAVLVHRCAILRILILRLALLCIHSAWYILLCVLSLLFRSLA